MGFRPRKHEEKGAKGAKGKGGWKAWLRSPEPYSVDKRPTFMQWVRITIVDGLTMLVFAGLAFGIFRLPPAADRTFPLTVTSTGEVIYPQFAHPYRPQYVSSGLAAALAIAVPIATFLAFQARVRSFWDLNNAVLGLLYSVELATVFQVFCKWLIGGLRPNFYDVCKPDLALVQDAATGGSSKVGFNGVGYQDIMFTKEVCSTYATGPRGLYNALQSFPSGHTTSAFAGFVFLYLYLNAKLKVFANYRPPMWKLALLYAPLLGCTLIGGSVTVDQSHNWYDVVAGATIGTVFAFSAYRVSYAAVWDFRINHIPLNRGVALSSRDNDVDHLAGGHLVATREVGWGPARRPSRRDDGILPTAEPRRSGAALDGSAAGVGGDLAHPRGTTRTSGSTLRGDQMV